MIIVYIIFIQVLPRDSNLPLSCCCCTAAAKLGCTPPRLVALDDANPVTDELKLVDVPDDITWFVKDVNVDPELGDELLGWELIVLLLMELDCKLVKPEESDFRTPEALELLVEAGKPGVPLAPPLPVEDAAAVEVATTVAETGLLLFL